MRCAYRSDTYFVCFTGGGLGRARVVSRRGVLFSFFFKVLVPISSVLYSYVLISLSAYTQ